MSFLELCGSTNDEARTLARAGAPHGTWIAARTQTSGRGRLARTWVSEPGNLFVSFTVRWPQIQSPWVPIAAGIWIAETLRELGALATLKWPNDLYVDQKKLGGILCEGETRFVIVGVGINCVSCPPGPEVRVPATSLKASGLLLTPDDLVRALEGSFTKHFPAAGVPDPESLVEAYGRLAFLRPGSPIRWADQTGEVLGMGKRGQLRVKDATGRERELFADEVDFDFK